MLRWIWRQIRGYKRQSDPSSRIALYCVLLVRCDVSFERLSPFDPQLDRLRTIVGYDRILVMDAGSIAVSSNSENRFMSFPLTREQYRNSTRLRIYTRTRTASFVACAIAVTFPWKIYIEAARILCEVSFIVGGIII